MKLEVLQLGKTIRNTSDGRDKKSGFRAPKWLKKDNNKREREFFKKMVYHEQEGIQER